MSKRVGNVSHLCLCSQSLSSPFFALLGKIESLEAKNYSLLSTLSTRLQ